METGRVHEQSGGLTARVQLAIVLAIVLIIRLPFLYQAIQGDDISDLAGAEHAQIDPLYLTEAGFRK